MPEKTQNTWSIPALPEFCGPDELSDVLVNWRTWNGIKGSLTFSDLSEEALRRLVSLCYYASQASEEGRFLRFRVIALPQAQSHHLPLVTKLVPPVPLLDVDALRKLVPAISSLDYILSVGEEETRLYCDGIYAAIPREGTYVGQPSVGDSASVPIGLLIRVDGPGEIRATEGGNTFLLRRASVRDLIPVHAVSQVRAWLAEASKHIHSECIEQAEKDVTHLFGGSSSIWSPLVSLWSKVLAEAVEDRHGAAFAILPQPETPFVKCKYKLEDLSLGQHLKKFWLTCARIKELKKLDEFERASLSWNLEQRRLLNKAQAISTLARTDGCVLIDRYLNVSGFGGKIQVDDEVLKTSGRQYSDPQDNEPIPESELSAFGARHQSAFRLCKAVGGALVFVVSQDGDLSVFVSDEKHVFVWESLSAWAGELQAW